MSNDTSTHTAQAASRPQSPSVKNRWRPSRRASLGAQVSYLLAVGSAVAFHRHFSPGFQCGGQPPRSFRHGWPSPTIGCFVICIAWVLNGCSRYNTAFPVHVQAACGPFGFLPVSLPRPGAAVRRLSGTAFNRRRRLNMVSATLFGFRHLVSSSLPFQFCRSGLSVLGFQGIKWLENIGSGFYSRVLCVHVLQQRSSATVMNSSTTC